MFYKADGKQRLPDPVPACSTGAVTALSWESRKLSINQKHQDSPICLLLGVLLAGFDSCGYFASFLLAVFPKKEKSLEHNSIIIPFILQFFVSFLEFFSFSPQKIAREPWWSWWC